jgi:hypothetical protein
MSTDEYARLERRLAKLGTRNPACIACGETNPLCLELHHIAGQHHHDDLSIVCCNCHRKVTQQQMYRPGAFEPADTPASIGHYLCGLADLFAMLAATLQRFGEWLIGSENHEGKEP